MCKQQIHNNEFVENKIYTYASAWFMAWLGYRRKEMNQKITTHFWNLQTIGKLLCDPWLLESGYCCRFCAILYVNSLISCSTIRLGIIGFSSILIDFRSRLSKVEVIVMLLWKAVTAGAVNSMSVCRLSASCKYYLLVPALMSL